LPRRFCRKRPVFPFSVSDSDFRGRLLEPFRTRPRRAVVEEGVDRLLQHPLLVPDDDLRGSELEELLQPVVPVDDAAVESFRSEVAKRPPSRERGAQLRRMTG